MAQNTHTSTVVSPTVTTQTTTRIPQSGRATTSTQTSTQANDFAPQQQRGVQDPEHDHPRPMEMGHGYGETAEQHAAHSSTPPARHFGLSPRGEKILFYSFAIPSWGFNIAAGILGSVYSTHYTNFIWTATVFQFLSWAAWWQTAIQMMQRASWVRDESNLPDRRRYLYLAVRLNRLMLVRFPFIFNSSNIPRGTAFSVWSLT